MTATFYLLEYEWDSNGFPAFLSGTFNHSEFEWDILDPSSLCTVPIARSYEFQVSDGSLAQLCFDFYDPRAPIVSADFLTVCDECTVNYRAVPLTIRLKSSRTQEGYFLLLPCESASLLDRERSEYREDTVLETGQVMRDRYFPEHPIYSSIRRFETKPCSRRLFHCIELVQLVADEEFRALSVARGLKGLKFVPIDEQFRYDPWGEIQALE